MPEDFRWLLLPVLVLAVALFGMVGVQSVELIRQQEALVALRATQESAMQQSMKMRQQLQALAGKTARLAEEGDAAAAAIVEGLRRAGITVNAPAK
jgi:uncharacterized protein HemX